MIEYFIAYYIIGVIVNGYLIWWLDEDIYLWHIIDGLTIGAIAWPFLVLTACEDVVIYKRNKGDL